MSTTFYMFRLLWPFLKEWILGGVSLKEGVKKSKRRVALLAFVVALIFALIFIVPRHYSLAQDHRNLKNSIEVAHLRKLENELEVLKKSKNQDTVTTGPPEPPPAKKEHVPIEPDELGSREENRRVTHARPSPKTTRQRSTTDDDGRKASYMEFFDRYDH